MNSTKKSSTNWLGIIVAFILGLLIGLVVLGWWLWPVQWYGGSFDTIKPDSQKEFLRASIDSYTLNLDQSLATQRYSSLGESRQSLLAELYNNPEDQDKLDIEAFALAVGAQDSILIAVISTPVESATPAESPAPANPITSLLSNKSLRPMFLPVCGFILVVLLVIILILSLFRRRRRSDRSQPVQEPPSGAEAVETAAESEELAPQYDVMTSQDIPSGVQETVKLDETLSQSESEIPDWLHEPAQIEATPAEEGMIEERKFELSEVDIQEIYASPFSTTETDLTVEQITEAAAVTSVPFLSEEEEFETPASIQESPDETYLKFSQDILDIPGIDPEIAKDLKATGIYAPLILLKRGATPQGRQTIASRLGVPEAEILALVSYVDLLRIQGLKLNDMQAFKLAGIASIPDLAAIDAMKLRAELLEISGEMDPAYSVPGNTTLENWINQARSLPQVIN